MRKILFVLAVALIGIAPNASAQTISTDAITSNGDVASVLMSGRQAVGASVTNTFTGTIAFYEAPSRGCVVAERNPILVFRQSTGTWVATATATDIYTFPNTSYRWVCLVATSSWTGTASITFIEGALPPPATGSGGGGGGLTDAELRAAAVAVSAASLPLPSGAATSAKQDTGNTSLATIATSVVDATLDRYLSVGTTEDEHQIKATPGTLIGISAWNAHASTDAFLKCTNLTAANTTPGSSNIFYSMLIPHAQGFVDSEIYAAFDTALTCYIVTGKANNDAVEVGAGDVGYNLRFK